MIETERYVAKTPTMDDLDLWQELLTNQEIMQYVRKKAHNREDVINYFMEPSMKHSAKHGFSMCSIFEKNTQKFVGIAGLIYLAYDDEQSDIEIGCFLHKEYWKQGCAQELAAAWFDWGFKHLKLDKIVAVANPLNENSWRAMERRGMKFIRNELYDKKYDVVRYEIYNPKSLA